LAVAVSVTGDPPAGVLFDAAKDTVHPDEEVLLQSSDASPLASGVPSPDAMS
jgi:hypothetical protein